MNSGVIRIVAIPVLSATLCCMVVADKPRLSRASVAAMEQNLDKSLATLAPEDPISVIGLTQGAYITGYGVIFMSEVNLAPAAGITPFHQAITKDEVTRIHQKNVDRLPKLKQVMQAALLSSSAYLDGLGSDDQIAVAISLFHFNWENVSGLPSQIVMHGPKKTLLAVQSGRAERSILSSTVIVEEF